MTLTTAIETVAYRCGACTKLHGEQEAAVKCCCCCSCGVPFFDAIRRRTGAECGHCLYSGRLRSARKEVRRHTEDLRRAESWLQQLSGKGKPPKGSPP